MPQQAEMQIDLRQMILAIEAAVSLVGMNDTNHGKRVGYIALQLAHHLDFTKEDKADIFELGLIHDCGVSSDSIHTHLVNQFDWEGASQHCEIGYNLLKNFKPLSHLALPILHHHTRWDAFDSIDIPAKARQLANLIFLADRVDVTSASFYGQNVLLHADHIRESIIQKKDTYFSTELVDCFLDISGPEAFWISLEDRHINRFAWDMAHLGHEKPMDMQDLKELARIFSYIVDQKSPFTAQHSTGVAHLCRYLAQQLAMAPDVVDKLEVAGYLHDIGKLHVPDNILDKPGPLSTVERSVINQHSYETYEILRPIKGLEDIAKWAAFHHESCIGNTGYPFHPPRLELSEPARIVAVADVFQALVQDRPYRSGMPVEKVVAILKDMGDQGKLDRSIVRVAVDNAEECFAMARG
ncbi:HD-GYP domain-containing protein [Pseudodesulfovibrio tunisiensis]|uniref:HD-GYP domain-containing protein n=1 Tax=Pseudodesulfovibrio tunisiensis TaxID=463192 RepID=UPI001FB47B19|nr:HD domain-containing phosphohydrolase [Pseudodesulfovibrio tunisiensis]